ncbi:MAG: ATP-binding protein, partial [Chloroflexota bacterium]|nr:ATP-binding protein [Chloroflexota bacterium]
MSNGAIWEEPVARSDERYPSALLKYLLHQMMVQFAAQGACIALYNEQLGTLQVQAHVRIHSQNSTVISRNGGEHTLSNSLLRTATDLAPEVSALLKKKVKLTSAPLEELEDVFPVQSGLFPIGTSYAFGQDLVGSVWEHKESVIMSHQNYLSHFHRKPIHTDILPACYLAAPIYKPVLEDELQGNKKAPRVIGVVILYQDKTGTGFSTRERAAIFPFTDRIALSLQNEELRQQQRRTSDYLERIQQISTAFPSTVSLANMLESVYQFTSSIVDVSSMLITFYDRDTNMIYDVFAVDNGKRVEELLQYPTIKRPEQRPLWWQIAQQKQEKLLLAPVHEVNDDYNELLLGIWGDQRDAASFLMVPMKMFTRVIGSLSITSTHPHAYHREEIQVLETMMQIITVSIENARLYESARQSLREGRQREELLATMNSTLQSIGSVLNMSELMQKFATSVALFVNAEMSVFFQLSPNKEELIAQAIYAPINLNIVDDGSDPQIQTRPLQTHNELIEQIRLPFKGTPMEGLVNESFFYLDTQMAEEFARMSTEGGAIFLRETGIQKMLMIPVLYQSKLMGIMAVHTPKQNRVFQPKEVGVLLAMCAQAASSLRNAQLFEEIQEAYAELQRMDTLKDEFLVTASHELRTPLSAISGYSSLLKKQSERIGPPQIMRFATKIEGAAQQLTALVVSMTEASRMGAVDKKLDLQIGPVQLFSMVDLSVTMLTVNIGRQIMVEVPEDLWVRADALRLRQVISNLLDNAAKYSPPMGRIEISATATTLERVEIPETFLDHAELVEHGNEPVVLVEVRDEGEGIVLEDQQKIFDKFVRAYRSLTTPVRGSGLGLYICRRYIEAMGGKLWLAESTPEGSIFRFYLWCEDTPPPISPETGEV